MGNTQSAPTPRRRVQRAQNKLSKPRTNNGSTTTLLNLKAPPAAGRSNLQLEAAPIISTRYSDLSAVVATSEEAKDEAPRKRMSLFKSKSSQGKQQKHEIEAGVDRHPDEPGPVEQPVHKWSKRSRSATPAVREPIEVPLYIPPSQRPNRMSLQQQARPSQTSLRQSIGTGNSTPQLEIAEERRLSRYDANGTPASPIGPRTDSEMDLYGPIRRRSLQQPGLATRKSFVEGDPRQSLPSQRISRETLSSEELQDYYYNPTKSTSSPLSNIATLRKRLNETPGPRTETPDDMDYGHIGAFKLGSLRITNGTASPVPSIDRPNTARSEDGRVTESRESNRERHRAGQRSKTFNVTSDKPWMPCSESPLRQSYEREPSKPLTIETQLPLPDSLFSPFLLFTTDSPTRSLDLARKYMDDLALSPFSFQNSPLPSPGLQVTSKHTALEDDLFSVEARTPSPDVANRALRSLDSGYDGPASPGLNRREDDRAAVAHPLAKADSGYSSNVSLRSFKGRNSKPTVPEREAPATPPKEFIAKEPVSRLASSNYSLHSLPATVREAAARRDISASSQLSRNPLSRAASSNYSAASYPSTVSDNTVKDSRQLSPQTSTEPTSRNASSNYSIESLPSTIPETLKRDPRVKAKHTPSPPPPVPSKSAEQIWKATQANSQAVIHPQPARRQTFDSAAFAHGVREEKKQIRPVSEATVSDPAPQWRAGNKKKPYILEPPELFTVQAMLPDSPGFTIPPVSQEASRKLGERVDGFPVASIPNTIKGDNGLRHTLSKETLGTIFSVGSAEQREAPTPARLQGALPPVPKASLVPKPEVKAPVLIAESKFAGSLETEASLVKAESSRRNTLQNPEPLPSLGYTSHTKAEARQSMPPQMASRERSPSRESKHVTNTLIESHLLTITRGKLQAPASIPSFPQNMESTPFVPQSVPSMVSQSAMATKSISEPVKRRSLTRGESQGGLRGAYKLQETSLPPSLQAKQSRDSISAPAASAPPQDIPTTTPATKPAVPERPKDPVRSVKRAYPPQAHEKFSRASMQRQLQMFENSLLALQQDPINTAYGEGMLIPGLDYPMTAPQSSRVKSPPPVTMQTQRKLMPVNLKALPFQPVAPPTVFQPPPSLPPTPPTGFKPTFIQPPTPPPNYPLPQYPPLPLIAMATNKQATPPQQHSPARDPYDPWAAQKQFWSTQRQSADLALQHRQSQDMSRPGSTLNSVEYQRPRLQPQSSDDYLASQSRKIGMNARRSVEIGRPGIVAPVLIPGVEEAARRSIEFHRWQKEAEQQMGNPIGNGSGSRRGSLESTQSWHAWRNLVMQQSQQQQPQQPQHHLYVPQIQQTLSHRTSVESTQSFQSARSNAVSAPKSVSFGPTYTAPMSSYNSNMSYNNPGTYDHTYGMRPASQKSDAQYYDGNSSASETYEERNLPRQLHHTSTEDMLVLKRLSSFRSESEHGSPNWTVHGDEHGGNIRRGEGLDLEFREKRESLRRVPVGA